MNLLRSLASRSLRMLLSSSYATSIVVHKSTDDGSTQPTKWGTLSQKKKLASMWDQYTLQEYANNIILIANNRISIVHCVNTTTSRGIGILLQLSVMVVWLHSNIIESMSTKAISQTCKNPKFSRRCKSLFHTKLAAFSAFSATIVEPTNNLKSTEFSLHTSLTRCVVWNDLNLHGLGVVDDLFFNDTAAVVYNDFSFWEFVHYSIWLVRC